MDASPIPSFLRSSVGRGFRVFVLGCAVMAAVVGVGTYWLNLHWFAVNKGDEKVTAAQLVNAFVDVYTTTRGQFMTHDAPVPSSFRAQAIERFNRDRNPDQALHLLWVGPPGREMVTPPSDANVAGDIAAFSRAAKPAPVTQFVSVHGALLLRTVYPVIASQPACVACHNEVQAARIAAGKQPPWRLNDVVGAAVLDAPASPFLHQSMIDSAAIAVAVFVLSTLIGVGPFYMQYKEFVRRAQSEASLTVAKDAAEAANRAKSIFLATMSHELRTPLNAIIGFSELLKNRTLASEADRVQGYAADIHQSGTHLLDVINDVLDLSKAEAGKIAIRDDVLEPLAAVDAASRVMAQRAAAGAVTLTAEGADNLPCLTADPRALRQMLLNLLSNAIKFTPAGGAVTARVELRADGGIAIAVRDTGIGMAPDDIPRALEPFQQIDNSLSRKYANTKAPASACRWLS